MNGDSSPALELARRNVVQLKTLFSDVSAVRAVALKIYAVLL